MKRERAWGDVEKQSNPACGLRALTPNRQSVVGVEKLGGFARFSPQPGTAPQHDAEITLAPVTHSGASELKLAFAVYVSNYLGWDYQKIQSQPPFPDITSHHRTSSRPRRISGRRPSESASVPKISPVTQASLSHHLARRNYSRRTPALLIHHYS
jgi:hypothetical protein